MTADPRGRWFRVYARQIRQHPKFSDLTVAELGAWTALRAEAELRDEAVFLDRADAVVVLRRRRAPRPLVTLNRLIERHLFDEEPDGRVIVHDRQDHDRAPYPSDAPDAIKERVRKHRQRQRNGYETNGNENVTTPVRARSGAGAASASLSEGGESEGRVPDDWDAPDAVVAYHQATGRYPSQKVIDWLNRLSDDHPDEAIARVLADEHGKDDNLGTLLSRTEVSLKLDAHRRSVADEKARTQAQLKAEAEFREQEREATPEQREQALLQQQAIRLGLRLGVKVPTDSGEIRAFLAEHGAA